jgi:hypothetical protein
MTVDTAQIAGIIITVGALLPLVTSVVEQQSWSKPTRTIAGLVISALAGLVTYVTQFGLDFSNPGALTTTIVGVILASGAAYKTVWEPSGIAPALERKSSPTPVKPDSEAAEGGEEDDELEIDQLDEEDVPEDVPEELEMPPGFDDGSSPVR